MPLAIVIVAAVWLLAVTAVLILCAMAKRGDAALPSWRSYDSAPRIAISDFTSPARRSRSMTASGK